MSTLNSLKMVNSKKPTSIPPVLHRRNKLANKVWEQLQLAKANKDGGTFTVKKFKTVKDSDGARRTIEHEKRIRQWWFVANDGKVCLNIRYGSQTLEISKGRPSVEVDNPNALIKALEIIKSAVEGGELDTQIEEASTHLRSRFTK